MSPVYCCKAVTSSLARCIAVCTLALAMAGCGRTPDVIKIGVAQPLSGPLSELGQDMLNGVQLAAHEINQEGLKLKGRKVTVEVLALDDQANPEQGKRVAQQLVDAGAVAVIGHLNSGVSIEAAPIYAAKTIAQLAISTHPRYTQLGLPTTFRLVGNDVLQAKALGSFAVNQLVASHYAVVDDGTPYGTNLAQGAAKQIEKAGKSISLRKSFDDKTTAFDELASEIKKLGIEVIVSTLNDFQALALVQELKKIDHVQVTLLGGDTLKTTAMLAADGVLKGGLYATSPILEPREFIDGKKFLAAYRSAYKKDPAYGGHYSYDAMHVLASAIRHAGSDKPEKITSSLRTVDTYSPVTGSMRFDANGEPLYGVIGIYKVRHQQWEPQLRSSVW